MATLPAGGEVQDNGRTALGGNSLYAVTDRTAEAGYEFEYTIVRLPSGKTIGPQALPNVSSIEGISAGPEGAAILSTTSSRTAYVLDFITSEGALTWHRTFPNGNGNYQIAVQLVLGTVYVQDIEGRMHAFAAASGKSVTAPNLPKNLNLTAGLVGAHSAYYLEAFAPKEASGDGPPVRLIDPQTGRVVAPGAGYYSSNGDAVMVSYGKSIGEMGPNGKAVKIGTIANLPRDVNELAFCGHFLYGLSSDGLHFGIYDLVSGARTSSITLPAPALSYPVLGTTPGAVVLYGVTADGSRIKVETFPLG